MSNLVNLPDSFGSYEEAKQHLEVCCELAGVQVKIPVKIHIQLLCQALGHNHHDIFERVKRGKGG